MAAKVPGLKPMAEVRRQTGLTERQIRYYEAQGLVHPVRSAGRQRLFSGEDVDRLLLIKQWLDTGMSLKTVRERLRDATPVDPVEDSDAPGYFRGQNWVRRGTPDLPFGPSADRSSWIRPQRPDDDVK
jgi:MerR family glutamine synthetase transcriptional repressor